VVAKYGAFASLQADMTRPTPDPISTAPGEAILDMALHEATRAWGERLVAAYALGSLAHGGFSPHVSDVDFGVVIVDPLEEADAVRATRIVECIKASGAALSDRLSVFWGSRATLAGRAEGGRFPPVDRADLREHGRLLAGIDVRAEVAIPSSAEMIVAAARLALARFSTDEAIAQCRDPSPLEEAGARALTKRILFPVRFLYTARTGRIGLNDDAVAHFLGVQSGPEARLARLALQWRYRPFRAGDREVHAAAAQGLVALYRLFIDEYVQRLRALGEHELAAAYEAWRTRLG
jgi:hypothetical protein